MWSIAAFAVVDRTSAPSFLQVIHTKPENCCGSSSSLQVREEDDLQIHMLLFEALDKCDAIAAQRHQRALEQKQRSGSPRAALAGVGSPCGSFTLNSRSNVHLDPLLASGRSRHPPGGAGWASPPWRRSGAGLHLDPSSLSSPRRSAAQLPGSSAFSPRRGDPNLFHSGEGGAGQPASESLGALRSTVSSIPAATRTLAARPPQDSATPHGEATPQFEDSVGVLSDDEESNKNHRKSWKDVQAWQQGLAPITATTISNNIHTLAAQEAGTASPRGSRGRGVGAALGLQPSASSHGYGGPPPPHRHISAVMDSGGASSGGLRMGPTGSSFHSGVLRHAGTITASTGDGDDPRTSSASPQPGGGGGGGGPAGWRRRGGPDSAPYADTMEGSDAMLLLDDPTDPSTGLLWKADTEAVCPRAADGSSWWLAGEDGSAVACRMPHHPQNILQRRTRWAPLIPQLTPGMHIFSGAAGKATLYQGPNHHHQSTMSGGGPPREVPGSPRATRPPLMAGKETPSPAAVDPRYLGMVAGTADGRFHCFARCAATGMKALVVTVSRRGRFVPDDDAMLPITRIVLESAAVAICNPFAVRRPEDCQWMTARHMHYAAPLPVSDVSAALLHSQRFQAQLDRILTSLAPHSTPAADGAWFLSALCGGTTTSTWDTALLLATFGLPLSPALAIPLSPLLPSLVAHLFCLCAILFCYIYIYIYIYICQSSVKIAVWCSSLFSFTVPEDKGNPISTPSGGFGCFLTLLNHTANTFPITVPPLLGPSCANGSFLFAFLPPQLNASLLKEQREGQREEARDETIIERKFPGTDRATGGLTSAHLTIALSISGYSRRELSHIEGRRYLVPMMNMNQTCSLTEMEILSTKCFSADTNDRQYAEGVLEELCNRENIQETPLLIILAESSNQYALFYVAQAILQWTKRNARRVTPEIRLMIVQRVGDALRRVVVSASLAGGAGGGVVPKSVVKELIATYAKLLKLGFETEPFLIDGVDGAMQLVTMASNDTEYHLGLELLVGILTEFSFFDSSKSQGFMTFTIHRRCSNNFRDHALLNIFVMALETLRRLVNQAAEQQQQSNNPANFVLSPQHPHLAETILLVQGCLSYDFMAILVDETEDCMSAQFPAAWRDVLLSDDTIVLLWRSLDILPLPHCTVMMRGLACLCGMRRTFFENPEDRQQYLNSIFVLFLEILMHRKDNRLVVSPNYLNEIAEGCSRFVAPFGYRDLHTSSMFLQWLTAIKDLTLEVLSRPADGRGAGLNADEDENLAANDPNNDGRHRDFSAPARTFMHFWGRLSSSFRMFVSSKQENEVPSSAVMEQFVLEIVIRFFQTRVSLQGPPIVEETKMLADAISSQCENCALLCLVNPAMTLSRVAEYLVQQVTVQALCSTSPSGLMWLFNVSGFLVRAVLANVEDFAVSAEAYFFRFVVDCVRCRAEMFNAMGDPRCASDVTSIFGTIVELGMMHFLSNVQLILCSDRMHNALQTAVVEIFQSPQNLFQFLLTHTGQNIMRQVDNGMDENVVSIMKSSMDLIAEACSHMLQNAAPQDFRFDIPPVVDLPLSQSVQTYRLRTNLYHMLWPLRMPVRYDVKSFNAFLSPIDHCIHQTLNGNDVPASYVAGWLRDLRGVARAVLDRQEAKADFVAWFCDRSPSLHTILQGPAGDSPIVIISFLRFAMDFISSKHGRNAMDRSSHSANGLLLFKIMCSFIQQIIERCITDEKIQMVVQGGPIDGAYEMMLKPLSLSMAVLRICVNENFVPFGAMWFYSDETYDNTLLGLLRMLSVFPYNIFKEYRKVSSEILRLLRSIAEEQTYHPIVKLSTPELETILNFAINRCEDVSIATGELLHGMSFLVFIAEMIRDVKDLSSQQGQLPMLGAGGVGMNSLTSTPPRSPIPSSYYVPGPDGQNLSLSSGTPGGTRINRTGSARSLRSVRRDLARLLEPIQGLWTALIRVAMNIIVTQDRAISCSCGVVFPIFETHPPFWFEFVEGFVQSYPSAKQAVVRDALALLSNAGTTSETFFSEVFSFRQKMREL
eukprot:gene3948-2811_t